MVKEENIGTVGKLIVTKELKKIIDSLHSSIGDKEWSGILFYKLTKGNLNLLQDLVFTAEFFYPMNIGEGASTSYDLNSDPSLGEDVVKAFDIYEGALECSTGYMHTHHSIGAFFSGTDFDEIKQNSKLYNYYISLVVDFRETYKAKIAIPTKTEVVTKSWFKNMLGAIVNIDRKKEEEILLIGELDVIIDNVVETPSWITDRVKALKEKKAKVNTIVFDRNSDFDYTDYFKKYNGNKHSQYVKPVTTTKVEIQPIDFLRALVNLSTEATFSVSRAIDELSKLKEDEVSEFEAALEGNIEIIHDKLYGSDTGFKLHCIQAYYELQLLSEQYGETEIFSIIDANLGEYVTL
jgi:hypothetical protein